jgi:hypothetical protein
VPLSATRQQSRTASSLVGGRGGGGLIIKKQLHVALHACDEWRTVRYVYGDSVNAVLHCLRWTSVLLHRICNKCALV